PLTTWSARDLWISPEEVGFPGSYTQTGDIFIPEMKRRTEMLSGEAQTLVKEIIRRIRLAIG
ncbi:MAG: electron transfer flavoprotein subunit beta, partial [Deltaproteobacteria bacterium]|nr:electron transfer flavoprotein subunit beta [Deltaproteobacteria bacterium]